MDRITQRDLGNLLRELNNGVLHIGARPVGAYDCDQAYGGIKLIQHVKGGGIRAVSCDGFGTKRQLYTFMRGMIEAKRSA